MWHSRVCINGRVRCSASSKDIEQFELQRQTQTSRLKAVAAKITSARELARRLAEEKQAVSIQTIAEPERIKREAAMASAQAAAEAARADAVARAVRQAELGLERQALNYESLKAENEALADLILELARDKDLARFKVQEIKQRFQTEEADMQPGTIPENGRKQAEELVTQSVEDIVNVFAGLAMAKQALVEQKDGIRKLQDLATTAASAGEHVFTDPISPCKVGQVVTIYYNASGGPLAQDNHIVMKLGWNKWEEIQEETMQRSSYLNQLGNWWSVSIQLPQELFRTDFVLVGGDSGQVDNNHVQDYHLSLTGGPTEVQVLERRAAELAAQDAYRKQKIAFEEDRMEKQALTRAEQAAKEGKAAERQLIALELMASARAVVEERRQPVEGLGVGQGVCYEWISGPPRAGQMATLAYFQKRPGGPILDQGHQIKVHIGYDNWWQKIVSSYPMSPCLEQKDRWVAEIMIPHMATVVDFVFSDSNRTVWDNNGGQDYHSPVLGSPSDEDLVKQIVESLRKETEEEMREREERAGRRAYNKVVAKAKAQRKLREIRYEYLYTEPLIPHAGEQVTLFYNPAATVLRGRPEVYVRGSWNRWTHPQCFVPTKMAPTMPGGLGFHKCTVDVPQDAHVMDVVFSDTGDQHGGFLDNNKGLDYHIPIQGAQGVLQGLHVVHVSVEMAPIAKVGGMGDVVTALGRAVQDLGHKVTIILPKYDCIKYDQVSNIRQEGGFHCEGSFVRVWKGEVEQLDVVFIEPENGTFWVGCIYGRQDDAARFGYFSNAALQYVKHFRLEPDVIHCHDWQTAPVAWGDRGEAKCTFTIHNLNYGVDLIGRAMAACDIATTVSPSYAREVSGHPAVAPNFQRFFGIRNGIDVDIWDPSQDKVLPVNYTMEDSQEGKAAAKAELRKRMNLSNVEVPLVGVVTRLTHQKGIHLIKHAAWRTLERGAQFVLLGSAPDAKVQGEFNALAEDLGRKYHDRARFCFTYDEPLSHLIYSACDMLLVPSMFEPCGLTQMIAMRYGTIPVVRKTGGLNDTVFDIDDDVERATAQGLEPNGFNFEGTDSAGLDYALNRALTSWYSDREGWNKLVKRVMSMDWSWNFPALDYVDLYYRAKHE